MLEKYVLPRAKSHLGNRKWTHQQDRAPAHSSRWYRTHFPDFISSDDWTPNSPGLNPLDYSVCMFSGREPAVLSMEVWMLYVQPLLKHGRNCMKTTSVPPSTHFLGDF
ncbi:hypothetical protein V3C99_012116 [Haemonchus contortus]|uniref:DDE_3 domain-containing protein n=1 Tax=Haemonchus contortus TaxID=6289 RepID=A0A7I4Y378_HAECO